MPFPFDPACATLWTLTREDKLASCEIAFVPTGVEARIMRNGKLLYARTFKNGDDTLEWAEEERKELLAKGWIMAGATMRSANRRDQVLHPPVGAWIQEQTNVIAATA